MRPTPSRRRTRAGPHTPLCRGARPLLPAASLCPVRSEPLCSPHDARTHGLGLRRGAPYALHAARRALSLRIVIPARWSTCLGSSIRNGRFPAFIVESATRHRAHRLPLTTVLRFSDGTTCLPLPWLALDPMAHTADGGMVEGTNFPGKAPRQGSMGTAIPMGAPSRNHFTMAVSQSSQSVCIASTSL